MDPFDDVSRMGHIAATGRKACEGHQLDTLKGRSLAQSKDGVSIDGLDRYAAIPRQSSLQGRLFSS